jgi:hypothetical protein
MIFPSSSTRHEISNGFHHTEIWVLDCKLLLPKALWALLVKDPMGPSHSYHIYISISMVEVHLLSNPTVGIFPYWTHRIEGSSTFGSEHLFFVLCMHSLESRNIKLPKEPKVSPLGSDLRVFQFICDSTPQTSEVPDNWRVLLAWGDVLNT